MNKFSIIIPVYNNFHLMNKALDSLKNQEYSNFELIIIDDCSTDNSYEKIADYINGMPYEIKIIRNLKNLGPGLSRNEGIKVVTGNYILFIDSDDYVDKNLLSLLNKILLKKKYDIVLFDTYFEKNGKLEIAKFNYGLQQGENSVSKVLVQAMGQTSGKCYKTDVIKENNITFSALKRGEDTPFFRAVVSFSKDIYYLNKPLYYYVQHKGSLMHQKEIETLDDIEEAFVQTEKFLRNKYQLELIKLSSRELIYTSVCSMINQNYTINFISKKVDEFNVKYQDWYKNSLKYEKPKYLRVILYCIHKKYFFFIKSILILRSLILAYKR